MSVESEFIGLLKEHQKIIYKVCNLYMQSHADKDDLFQEITLQAWKAYANFRGDSKFSTWLYRVALNTAITFYRKEKKNIVFNVETVPELSENIIDHVEEKTKAMYLAIGELSKIDKAIVMLYLEDYTYTQISEIIGITPNNIAVKMNRIKIKLKEQTKKYYTTH
jgi:RNA polymerase sigma-70 factor (ECF subfamily)